MAMMTNKRTKHKIEREYIRVPLPKTPEEWEAVLPGLGKRVLAALEHVERARELRRLEQEIAAQREEQVS